MRKLAVLVPLAGFLSACGSAAPGSSNDHGANHANGGGAAESPAAVDSASPLDQDVFTQGLAAWRAPHERGACANCHTVDAVDLARIGFSDSTILRRAFVDHASTDDAFAIVRLVHFQRQRLHITAPFDPVEYRPLQPGGALLPGDTIAERDQALFDELAARGLAVASPTRIETVAAAKDALSQLLAIDLRTLRIGIPLNRWTEDVVRGEEHRTLNKWIPEIPRRPKAGSESTWYALHDAYIAAPTPANLWQIEEHVDELTDNGGFIDPDVEINEVFRNKYLAVQIAGHMFRTYDQQFPDFTQSAKDPRTYTLDSDFEILRNRQTRFWDVGAAAKSAGFTDVKVLPDFVQAKIPLSVTPTWDHGGQADNLTFETLKTRVSWFWLGMTYDPALQFSGGSNRDEYFGEGMGLLQYDSTYEMPIHEIMRRAFIEANTGWGRDTRYANNSANGDDLCLAFGLEGLPPPEVNGAHLDKFALISVNVTRMFLLLAIDYFERGGSFVHDGADSDRHFDQMIERAQTTLSLETPDRKASMSALIERLQALGKAAPAVRSTPLADPNTTFFVSPMKSSLPFVHSDAVTQPPAVPLGEAYRNACSGCHGDNAEGHPELGYPALRGLSQDRLRSIARLGLQEHGLVMPAFDGSALSDASLDDIIQRVGK